MWLPPTAPGADARFLGTPELSGWGTKGNLVARCLEEKGVWADDALFIDDDAIGTILLR
jgi:hypothetical protein